MLDEYPMILTPADVMKILNLPKNQTYNLFRSKSFPSELIGGKHIIPKPRFMKWLGTNDKESSTYERVGRENNQFQRGQSVSCKR